MPEPASVPDHEQLVVSFETPAPEADAAAVAETLRALVALLNAAINEVKPGAKFAIKTRAPSPGSLEVILEIAGAAAIFVGANLSTIADAVKLMKYYVELRLLGKGKSSAKAESKDQINLTVNNSGTIDLLLNSQVNVAVGEAAKAIEADPTIKSVSVLQGEDRDPIIKVKREQLGYLKYDENASVVELPARRERSIKNASLVVRAPDLLGDSKWAFNYKDHRIEASLNDDGFLSEVRSGKRSFTAGTEIVADMTAEEEFDPVATEYVPRTYTISKVHSLKKQKLLSDNPMMIRPKRKGKGKGKGKGKK